MAIPISIVHNNELENLSVNLHRLMQDKNINEAELARRSNVPQPTLHKILSGKTDDPRASTLKALANFFEVSIDELFSTNKATTHQKNIATQSIPVISWSECLSSTSFIANLTAANWSNWVVSEQLSAKAFGLISKTSMEPCFPRKTTLIIDPEIIAEDGDMVVIHYPNTHEATLRKLSIDGPVKLLMSVNASASHDNFHEEMRILGVLVKAIFSFHG